MEKEKKEARVWETREYEAKSRLADIGTELYDRIYNEGYNAKIRDKNEKLRVEDRKYRERTLMLNGQYNDNVKADILARDKHTRIARIHMMFNTITWIVIAAALMALVIVV